MSFKQSARKSLFVVVIIVLLLVVGALWFMKSKNVFEKKMAFGIETSRSDISNGDRVQVDIVLSDDDRKNVTAYDLQLEYDRSVLKLVSANPGDFFVHPMIVKWDAEAGWFSAAASPSGYKDTLERVNPDKPVLHLEFMALSPTNKTALKIKETSQIYVYQKGVTSPKSAQFEFSIH